jgi:hypothetical protein
MAIREATARILPEERASLLGVARSLARRHPAIAERLLPGGTSRVNDPATWRRYRSLVVACCLAQAAATDAVTEALRSTGVRPPLLPP